MLFLAIVGLLVWILSIFSKNSGVPQNKVLTNSFTQISPTASVIPGADHRQDDSNNVFLPIAGSDSNANQTPEYSEDEQENVDNKWITRVEPLMKIQFSYPASWYLDDAGIVHSKNTVLTLSTYNSDPLGRDWTQFKLTAQDAKVLLSWKMTIDEQLWHSVQAATASTLLATNTTLIESSELHIANKNRLVPK